MVSNVLNRPETVPLATQAKVTEAITELGYVRGVPSGELAICSHSPVPVLEELLRSLDEIQ